MPQVCPYIRRIAWSDGEACCREDEWQSLCGSEGVVGGAERESWAASCLWTAA